MSYEELLDDVIAHSTIGGNEYPAEPLYYVADFCQGDIDDVPIVTAFSSQKLAADIAASARKLLLNSPREVYTALCPNIITPWAIGAKLLYYIPSYDIEIDRNLNMQCEDRYHVKLMSDYINRPHIKCMTGYYKLINNDWMYMVNEHHDLHKIDIKELRSDISTYYGDYTG